MSTDFRALCAELLKAWDSAPEFDLSCVDQAMDNARAALAQPEPQGPSDEALASFTAWFCRNYPGPDTIIHKPEWHAPKVFRAAESAIARWGRPATTEEQQ